MTREEAIRLNVGDKIRMGNGEYLNDAMRKGCEGRVVKRQHAGVDMRLLNGKVYPLHIDYMHSVVKIEKYSTPV